jgi:hypothetical protein
MARPSTFGINSADRLTIVKEKEMMIVQLGYANYVMPTKDAVQVLEILEKAERYVHKYRSGNESTHHVWPNDSTFDAKMIGNELYSMAKLAGKPED